MMFFPLQKMHVLGREELVHGVSGLQPLTPRTPAEVTLHYTDPAISVSASSLIKMRPKQKG